MRWDVTEAVNSGEADREAGYWVTAARALTRPWPWKLL
jgi:hypothetical protein